QGRRSRSIESVRNAPFPGFGSLHAPYGLPSLLAVGKVMIKAELAIPFLPFLADRTTSLFRFFLFGFD
ncbi:MAG: hypothetical protein WCJ35_21325, partial [Planctomycetota bacterium]